MSKQPADNTPKREENPIPATFMLYVKEQADRARNQAIGIFAFIALILSIGTGLGAYQGAKSYIDSKIKEGQLEEFRKRANTAASEAETAEQEARGNATIVAKLREQAEKDGLIKPVQQKLIDVDTEIKALETEMGTKLQIGKEYLFKSVTSGDWYIGIHNGVPGEGNPLDVAACNNTDPQAWTVVVRPPDCKKLK